MPPETVSQTLIAEEYSFCNRRTVSDWTDEITPCEAITNSIELLAYAWSDGADWYDNAEGDLTGWSDWPWGGGE
jgi:hypothetical protein